MVLPDWMHGPDAPQPEQRGDWFPHVIDQRPDGDGTVLVTYALPGLRTGTVRVPQSSWLNGEHLAVGDALAQLVLPPPVPPPGEYIPDDDTSQYDNPDDPWVDFNPPANT